MDPRYSEELDAATKQLQRLKRRLSRRRGLMAELQPESAHRGKVAPSQGERVSEVEARPDTKVKQLLAECLLDPSTKPPIDSQSLHKKLCRGPAGQEYEKALSAARLTSLDPIIQDLASSQPPLVEAEKFDMNHVPRMMILSVDTSKIGGLVRLGGSYGRVQGASPPQSPSFRRERRGGAIQPNPKHWEKDGRIVRAPQGGEIDVNALLAQKSVKDRLKRERGEELIELIQKRTAKESATVEKFQTGGAAVREFCKHLTKDECRNHNRNMMACPRLHFRRLICPWTDVSLGNCSYLDTCRNINTCKYVHYELDSEPDALTPEHMKTAEQAGPSVPKYLQALPEPQFINCDVRTFDMSVLGKFGVIMADPPWEIHQDLPYGTMADDEMRKLNIACLQDNGVIFLWVTGRAMELGRECLELWGYKRVDELVWVKTNQLQRLIRTGRTGHWLNHSKEHCLVGVKGRPDLNRFVDCDVVVAEVRETSRKPDEMYPLLERLSPGTRKLEIFARMHNRRPGWVSLGNQLNQVAIKDPEMKVRYEKVYGKIEEK
ncbi:hypothetical protein BSKO_08970 [Bryopsis sp. KO-2023]|nr:hypothetical protein BSKO_08970 [Bryopsis sp. KO-2023]